MKYIRKGYAGVSEANRNRVWSMESRKKIIDAFTEDKKEKLRERNRNRIWSESTIKKKSDSFKGVNNPNYRKSEKFKGEKNPFWGKHHTEKTKLSISKSKKDCHPTEEVRKKMGDAHRGSKCHLWKGGISFEPYTTEWNRALKDKIRERDNHVCQECGRVQGRKSLHIHHIDYNKKNCNPDNLITLCGNCNSKANSQREKWQIKFETKMAFKNMMERGEII